MPTILSALKRSYSGLKILASCLIITNLAVVYFFGLDEIRLAVLTTTLVVFLYYVTFTPVKSRWIMAFFALFLLKDIAMFFYEYVLGYKLAILFGILSYLVLLRSIWGRVKSYGNNPLNILLTVVLVALNMYTLYVLMNQISYQFSDLSQVILFYTYGAIMMALGIAAVVYNNKFNSNRSLLFMFVAFGFIFADVASLLAYYFELDPFYYFDRSFVIVGLTVAVAFGNRQEALDEMDQYLQMEEELEQLKELHEVRNS
ncbi:hypothetical protein [Croceiramulus getboli]|nr:hypothetical protein P8624_08080 [Flavobacteriaceae bacterium YJPT1-3]